MTSITFLSADGRAHTLDAPAGCSLMDLAVMNGVPGILGDCGGSASCGTCHLIVDDAFAEAVGPITAVEEQVLEGRADRQSGSRLACQIVVGDTLDGLVVRVPANQY